MNIFYLHEQPMYAARLHCDKHVVKMIIETAQMLSTAHRLLDGTVVNNIQTAYLNYSKDYNTKNWKKPRSVPILPHFGETNTNSSVSLNIYQTTHQNHPCTKWVRETSANYNWSYALLKQLLNEYTHRYNKIHNTNCLLIHLQNLPKKIPIGDFTQPDLCMPDEFKVSCPVQSYKNFYNSKPFKMVWTNRKTPDWYKNENSS